MLRFTSFCLLLALQVVYSEVPMHCRGPPVDVKTSKECCDIPMIFKEEDLKDCGIEKNGVLTPETADCSKHVCIFKKYKLMKDDTAVNTDAVAGFLDAWADTNPDFKEAIGKVKENCLAGDIPGPPEICPATKVLFCAFFTTFMNCPKWQNSDNCNKLKDHIEECKTYF